MTSVEWFGLERFVDDRGSLFEILRSDQLWFKGFGQVYCSEIRPNVIKGYHKHKKQYDQVCCVEGEIKLIVRDVSGKIVFESVIGEQNPTLVIIPPTFWHGWKNIGSKIAKVINIATEPYNRKIPDEERTSPFKWGGKEWETIMR